MKKKILIFSIYPAPYRVELFERFFRDFDVIVFFTHSGGDAREEEWFVKGNYYLLDTRDGRKKYQREIDNIDNYEIAIIYDYAMMESIKLILRCRKKKIPYVVNADGVMLTSHGNLFKDFVKRYLLAGASAYLASGERAKEYFLQLGAKEEKIHKHPFSTLNRRDILEQAITREEKISIRKRLGLKADKKIAIAVGRFIPLKRYLELIEAWKMMPQDYMLLLIGGGEEEIRYKKCIEEKQIKNVVLEGFHQKEELFEYYKASDVFVHPTSYDVWGLVVNEAMACGLPVIVSDHCVAGLELIEEGKNGYLVEMGHDADLCERVLEIFKDDETYNRMAMNALKTIRPYTIENMADIHVQVFKEILEIA